MPQTHHPPYIVAPLPRTNSNVKVILGTPPDIIHWWQNLAPDQRNPKWLAEQAERVHGAKLITAPGVGGGKAWAYETEQPMFRAYDFRDAFNIMGEEPFGGGDVGGYAYALGYLSKYLNIYLKPIELNSGRPKQLHTYHVGCLGLYFWRQHDVPGDDKARPTKADVYNWMSKNKTIWYGGY